MSFARDKELLDQLNNDWIKIKMKWHVHDGGSVELNIMGNNDFYWMAFYLADQSPFVTIFQSKWQEILDRRDEDQEEEEGVEYAFIFPYIVILPGQSHKHFLYSSGQASCYVPVHANSMRLYYKSCSSYSGAKRLTGEGIGCNFNYHEGGGHLDNEESLVKTLSEYRCDSNWDCLPSCFQNVKNRLQQLRFDASS